MEPLSSSVGRVRAALCLLPFVLSGCASTDSFFTHSDKPNGPAFQVVTAWNPDVVFTPDPVHSGAPTPGLAGRMYLFGEEISYPVVGDGKVVVDLFNDTPGAGRPDVPLERWEFDKDTLKRLERRDAIGWGYTLFLPWGTYRPDITQVHIRLRYMPAKGSPLYAQDAPMLLHKNQLGTPVESSFVSQH